MTVVNNSATLQEVRDVAQIQQARESTPNGLLPHIQLVAEVNPKLLRRAKVLGSGNGSTAGTLFTTHAVKDTYITGVSFAITSDATSAGKIAYIQGVIDGKTVQIAYCSIPTGVVAGVAVYCSIHPPIKVDRGIAISVQRDGTFAQHGTSVHGYEVENNLG